MHVYQGEMMDKGYIDCSESDDDCRKARQLARLEGVKNTDNLPYMLVPPNAQVAVLLVHGFTASPWEMRLLAECLASAGHSALAVRLPGHGTTPKDLAKRRWTEWLDAVEQGYRTLSRLYSTVVAAGMSTGCLLCLSLSLKVPLQGLVLFSPYLRIKHRLAGHAGWLRWLRTFHEPPHFKFDLVHYYHQRPVAGIHQINQLIGHVKPSLSKCDVPVLAFNGEADRTIDIESGRDLVKALGSPLKIYQSIGPGVPHILTREENPCLRQMFDLTMKFIQHLEEQHHPHGSNIGKEPPPSCVSW